MIEFSRRIMYRRARHGRLLLERFDYSPLGVGWTEYDAEASAAPSLSPFLVTAAGELTGDGLTANNHLLYRTAALPSRYSFTYVGRIALALESYNHQLKLEVPNNFALDKQFGLVVTCFSNTNGTTQFTVGNNAAGGTSSSANVVGVRPGAANEPVTWKITGQVVNRIVTASIFVAGYSTVDPTVAASGSASVTYDASAFVPYNAARTSLGQFFGASAIGSTNKHFVTEVSIGFL